MKRFLIILMVITVLASMVLPFSSFAAESPTATAVYGTPKA